MTRVKPENLTPVDLVISDCDGTLVDSETVPTEVMVDYLAELGTQLSFYEALIRFKDGRMADCVVTLEAMHAAPLPGDFARFCANVSRITCINACSQSEARWS